MLQTDINKWKQVQTSLSHVTHCSFLKLDFRPRPLSWHAFAKTNYEIIANYDIKTYPQFLGWSSLQVFLLSALLTGMQPIRSLFHIKDLWWCKKDLYTLERKNIRTIAVFRCKMAFFKWACHNIIVLPRPWSLGST